MTEQKDLRSALEPCPLCQAEASLVFGGEVGRFDQYDVDCTGCGLYFHGPTIAEGEAAKAATIAAWNRRALASDTIGSGGGEHWSRQGIVKIIINAMVEAKGDVKAVPAGKAADHILSYLAPALSHPPAAEPVGLRLDPDWPRRIARNALKEPSQ